jgi:hypothetical protein
LKATLYRAAAEAYTPLAIDNKPLQKQCLTYLDSAARIIRKGSLEPDASYVKPDIASIQIERAATLTDFKRYKDAHTALVIAHEHLHPGNVRRQRDFLLAEAETSLAENELDGCCESILESFESEGCHVLSIELVNQQRQKLSREGGNDVRRVELGVFVLRC